jgi:3,2-trans-enoyl-CoA isomerase
LWTGNDIQALYAPNTTFEKYQEFWLIQNKFLQDLYASRLFTVAAIRGACPAGGTAISMCCDCRIALESSSLGLNEVALGIPVPKYWCAILISIVGTVTGESMLFGAKLINSNEALAAGFLHSVLPDTVGQQGLVAAAEALTSQMQKTGPQIARAATKLNIRGDFIARWKAYLPEESKLGWAGLSSSATVKALGQVLERLSGAKKAPIAKL